MIVIGLTHLNECVKGLERCGVNNTRCPLRTENDSTKASFFQNSQAVMFNFLH